ncbi:18156_t:CDS:2, partial [Racocetra fulgida]
MNAVKILFVEIEGYWNDLKFENNEYKETDEFMIDFSQWMRRFIADLALNMNFGDHAFSMAELKGNNEKAIKPMDEREIFGVLLEFFVAGVETSYMLHCLLRMQHPSVKQKLIQELDSVFPTTLPSKTSRLKTNPPINPRELYEQDEIGGYTIPKGATVIACVDAIHLHKDYWENPTEFIPERFLSDDYPLS